MLVSLVAALSFQAQVGESVVATGHLLDPIGKHIVLNARPVDLQLTEDGNFALIKENRGLTVVRTSDWSVVSEEKVAGAASMHGLAIGFKGAFSYSDAASSVHTGTIDADGKIVWGAVWKLPTPAVKGAAYPCGMDYLGNGDLAVCASRSNTLVRFGPDGTVKASIDLDVAPFGVTVTSGDKYAFVTCWGRKPGKRKGMSSGSAVDVDDRSVATGGVVDVVDLDANKVVATMPAGQQPSEITGAGDFVYVANANSDTICVYDTRKLKRVSQIVVKPDARLPFGSAPNTLCADGHFLYVGCGGNNAVAVLTLEAKPKILGFLPTDWYPSAVRVRAGQMYIACVKGIGSRNADPDRGFNVHRYTGTVIVADVPKAEELVALTDKVRRLAYAPEILQNLERSPAGGASAAVPQRLGDPSPIQHVVYVVKENRTYDQVLGDIGRGASEPKLAVYGATVTPNHHALANEFVLLDNYYCNGVNSADGHAWVTEGVATSYLERSFGGFTRSYPFGGDDVLSAASSGYIWDAVLRAGRSFRNYGEGDYAFPKAGTRWKALYDANARGEKSEFAQNIAIEKLRRYSCRDFPGWNLGIPDQLRADVFLRELKEFEAKGTFPNMTIVYLPQDHTSGTQANLPQPKSDVADNDLAVGRVVDALSHSKFWPKMAIFVIEDDAQDGFDHVDGHRSFCLVASPYARRGAVVSKFYNQTSVIHTILRILGVSPMNQFDAFAPLMMECFQAAPDLTPYTFKPNQVQIDLLNVPTKANTASMALSAKLDFSKPDAADEDVLNRILWSTARPGKAYPRASSRELKKRGLKVTGQRLDDD
jgi:DNA-binding beta-propeller fold protein YncE